MGQGAYDALVVEYLNSGNSLETAIALAGISYPDEELAPDTDALWNDLAAYYGMLYQDSFEIRDNAPDDRLARRDLHGLSCRVPKPTYEQDK